MGTALDAVRSRCSSSEATTGGGTGHRIDVDENRRAELQVVHDPEPPVQGILNGLVGRVTIGFSIVLGNDSIMNKP